MPVSVCSVHSYLFRWNLIKVKLLSIRLGAAAVAHDCYSYIVFAFDSGAQLINRRKEPNFPLILLDRKTNPICLIYNTKSLYAWLTLAIDINLWCNCHLNAFQFQFQNFLTQQRNNIDGRTSNAPRLMQLLETVTEATFTHWIVYRNTASGHTESVPLRQYTRQATRCRWIWVKIMRKSLVRGKKCWKANPAPTGECFRLNRKSTMK